MDLPEVGPGSGSNALLMQMVVSQVQDPQMDAVSQFFLCHLLNYIFTHLKRLYMKDTDTAGDAANISNHLIGDIVKDKAHSQKMHLQRRGKAQRDGTEAVVVQLEAQKLLQGCKS